MKNHLLGTVALTLLATMAVSAQTINLKATVPFSFSVNRATLPSGQYALISLADAGTVLGIRNLDSRTTSFVLSLVCTSGKASGKPKLVFHRYGSHYFLSQVWMEGNDRGREIPQGAREKEIAKDYSMNEVVLVASR